MAHHSHKRARVEALPLPHPSPIPPSNSIPHPPPPIDFTRYHHITLPPWSPPPSSSPTPLPPPPLPTHLWGLDPLYFSHVKLFISHLLLLPRTVDPPTFLLSSHPLTSVELVGVIVGVDRRERWVGYLVDDSTGVVQCKVWGGEGGEEKGWGWMEGGEEGDGERLGLGVVVRVMGRVVEWRGEREVNVSCIRVERDEGAEMLHWMECIRLYEDVYSQESAIGRKHRGDVEKMSGDKTTPPQSTTTTTAPAPRPP